MKKIGIISELNLNNFNYGNRLQVYALNKYLNENFDCEAESIYLTKYDHKKITKFYFVDYLKKVVNKIIKKNTNSSYFNKRIKKCNDFLKNNAKISSSALSWEELLDSDYDYFITGSDVVWAQHRGEFNRIRFLDFENKKGAKKISYAASFGKDWIPNENKIHIKSSLDKYDLITVREKSSVKMLNNIDVKNVHHVCDPTLLLDSKDWEKVEKKLEINDDYIFVYLLGKNVELRKKIKDIAKLNNLKIVTIPDSDGILSNVDNDFADINLDDCSPENWIWLIHHATYIITDSFHGCIFSSIFEKQFIVTKRDYSTNINNRMIDYLTQIDELDKFVDINQIDNLSKFKWMYDKINNHKNKLIENSKKILMNYFK